MPALPMTNLAAVDRPALAHTFARHPALTVHLYGKQVRAGRKVGHVTAYGEDLDEVRERARHAAAWFRGDLGMESE